MNRTQRPSTASPRHSSHANVRRKSAIPPPSTSLDTASHPSRRRTAPASGIPAPRTGSRLKPPTKRSPSSSSPRQTTSSSTQHRSTTNTNNNNNNNNTSRGSLRSRGRGRGSKGGERERGTNSSVSRSINSKSSQLNTSSMNTPPPSKLSRPSSVSRTSKLRPPSTRPQPHTRNNPKSPTDPPTTPRTRTETNRSSTPRNITTPRSSSPRHHHSRLNGNVDEKNNEKNISSSKKNINSPHYSKKKTTPDTNMKSPPRRSRKSSTSSVSSLCSSSSTSTPSQTESNVNQNNHQNNNNNNNNNMNLSQNNLDQINEIFSNEPKVIRGKGRSPRSSESLSSPRIPESISSVSPISSPSSTPRNGESNNPYLSDLSSYEENQSEVSFDPQNDNLPSELSQIEEHETSIISEVDGEDPESWLSTFDYIQSPSKSSVLDHGHPAPEMFHEEGSDLMTLIETDGYMERETQNTNARTLDDTFSDGEDDTNWLVNSDARLSMKNKFSVGNHDSESETTDPSQDLEKFVHVHPYTSVNTETENGDALEEDISVEDTFVAEENNENWLLKTTLELYI